MHNIQRNLDLTPENVQVLVETALALDDQLALIPVPNEPGLLMLPALRGSWQACAEGIAHPHTGELRPIVFDHDRLRGRDGVRDDVRNTLTRLVT